LCILGAILSATLLLAASFAAVKL